MGRLKAGLFTSSTFSSPFDRRASRRIRRHDHVEPVAVVEERIDLSVEIFTLAILYHRFISAFHASETALPFSKSSTTRTN